MNELDLQSIEQAEITSSRKAYNRKDAELAINQDRKIINFVNEEIKGENKYVKD